MLLAPIVIQAERGELGNAFAAVDDGQGTQYLTITGTMGGGAPASEARVIRFEVEFPASGSGYSAREDVLSAVGSPEPETPREPAGAGPAPSEDFGADAGP